MRISWRSSSPNPSLSLWVVPPPSNASTFGADVVAAWWMIAVRSAAYDHPTSWFVGRSPGVRPRKAVRKTIEMAIEVAWPHRFVLRETCDLLDGGA